MTKFHNEIRELRTDILPHDPTCTNVEMADFTISHQPLR